MKLKIKVVPKSSRNAVAGWMGDTLKICVSAAPEQGKANFAVREVLAEALDLPKDQVLIASGHASPRKVVEIAGISEAEVRQRLAAG
ncbi:MAG TPA: DUF167 domain-containing protein [Burkholderiales bacterium]|nr:DUF167 domain-containing protein [Burkholderiales bacterium]